MSTPTQDPLHAVRELTRARAKVMLAFADGAPIKGRTDHLDVWIPESHPMWDWVRADYQIDLDPRVDWSKLPAWANYVARESSGRWWWFESRPKGASSAGWNSGDGDLGCIPEQFEPQYAGDLPWDKLLVERPSK